MVARISTKQLVRPGRSTASKVRFTSTIIFDQDQSLIWFKIFVKQKNHWFVLKKLSSR